MGRLSWLRLDGFTLAILAAVVLALLVPCSGESARLVAIGSEVAIILLFFLQGARLPRRTVLAGILHWRLHLTVIAATFVAFPLLGLALGALAGPILPRELYLGLLFLCAVPSTVQSSVVFTSIAGGNVAAALGSASISGVLGMVLTPLLAGLLINAGGTASFDGVGSIFTHLLLPFLVGQAAQPRIEGWISRRRRLVGLVDRASVLLMVYGAFSAAALNGLWSRLPVTGLLAVALIEAALLAAMLVLTAVAARRLGFSREDEIAIVFCGSKKSLVTGVSMATALFAGPAAGLMVLPLMIFHQMQLMACATLAQRYAQGVGAVPPRGGVETASRIE